MHIGTPDKMGMNVVLLKELTPDEPKVMTLDLLKNMDLAAYVQFLIVRKSGPVFLTSFRPVTTIFIAIMGVLILGEAIYLKE